MFFKDFVSVKGEKIRKGASQTYDTPSCNRPPVLGTASLYGWRTIKGLRQVLRAGTAWGITRKNFQLTIG